MTDQPYTPPPERTTPWPIVLGVAVLGVLAAVLLLLVLTRGPDDETASGSATPTPSASAGASVSPTESAAAPSPSVDATAAPSPTPDQAASIGLPADLLPPGAVITVTADAVRIRTEPTTDSEVAATMSSGDAAFVEDAVDAGPVTADGYHWYQIAYAGGRDAWPWQDVAPDGYVTGWVAAGTADQRFLELAEVTCPDEPVTLEILALDMTAWGRLVCLRDAPITVEGTYGCDGCGGVTGAQPAWLGDVTQHPPIAGQYRYYPFIRVAIPPETDVPNDRDIIRATLHVDDPAAATCTYTHPDGTTPAPAVDPVAVQTFCRERLVLDTFEVLGKDDFGG